MYAFKLIEYLTADDRVTVHVVVTVGVYLY